MWGLIVSVPDHCLSFYFTLHIMIEMFSLHLRNMKSTHYCLIKMSIKLTTFLWTMFALCCQGVTHVLTGPKFISFCVFRSEESLSFVTGNLR